MIGYFNPQPKPQKKIKKIKRIPQISKKKRDRLKQFGTELDLFKEIWNERPHVCEICEAWILEPKTWTFAHKNSKAVYPELRYEKTNIALVCSLEHHLEIDRLRNKHKKLGSR